ncbi:hypothetical protein J6590_069208 [Homalodisca vitripennis]|nr:hypothetical protein J6590_069208 [Homalodisca vitripennis]
MYSMLKMIPLCLGSFESSYPRSVVYAEDDPTLPRVLGMYSILKAIALIHCTVFIHYRPIISMGICSLLLTIIMYLMEALYYQSATLNFYIIFPCALNSKYPLPLT